MSEVFVEPIEIELEADGFDSPEEQYRGTTVSQEGWYHVVVLGVSDKPGRDPDGEQKGNLRTVKLDMQILAGCDLQEQPLPRQRGLNVYKEFYVENWKNKDDHSSGRKSIDREAGKRLKTPFWAFGVFDENDLKSEKLVFPFHLLAGRQAIVKVTRESDWTDKRTGETRPGRLSVRWNSDFYPLSHDKVASIPKDQDYLALVGVGAGQKVTDDMLSDL